jgi:site-specific DNA recombinase
MNKSKDNSTYYGSTIELADVYSDEELSGTRAEKRTEFLRMIADCDTGKIDYIITKSISRFARNTLECLSYVKHLKEKGIYIYFEKERLDTSSAASEMLLSIMAAVAQEESRSISENVKWRYAKNFEKGVYHLGGNRILGYDMNEEGKLEPNEDAWIIKRVFDNYVSGMSLGEVADELNKAGAKRLRCDKPFDSSLIWRMVRNECYVGDKLLQKNPPRDYLTKLPDTSVEYNSYYIKDDHDGIIDRETWEAVKERIETEAAERSAGVYRSCTKTHFLYGKVFCAECGSPYTRRTFTNRQGESYKAWCCRGRKKGGDCKNGSIKEDELLGAVVEVLGMETFEQREFEVRVERIVIEGERIRVEVREGE